MKRLCCPPASKAGPGRRPLRFWTVLRRWVAGLYRASARKQSSGKWEEPYLGDEIAMASGYGDGKMGTEMARALLSYSVELMFLISKKTKLVDEFGRKVCTVDRIRAIQSGHTFNRNLERMTDAESEEFFPFMIGEWNLAWQGDRPMQYNVIENRFGVAEIAHH